MHKLLEKISDEIKEYEYKEGELSPSDWDAVCKAVKIKKDILTCMAMEGEDKHGNHTKTEVVSSLVK